jgi:hypothetical protein
MTQVGELIAGLTDLERELLTGRATGWGSWMFEVGADLCAKGLARRENGSIHIDTPLAKQVLAALQTKPDAKVEAR